MAIPKEQARDHLRANRISSGKSYLPLAELVAEALHLESVPEDSNFLMLGGDSVQALILSFQIAEHGYSLEVIDILSEATISELASHAVKLEIEGQPAEDPQPFELLGDDAASVKDDAAQQIGCRSEDIEDAYPCSSMQVGLFEASLRHHGTYVNTYTYQLPVDFNSVRFHNAWSVVFEKSPILRTRIIYSSRLGAVQVIVREMINWKTFASLEAPSEELVVDYGKELTSFALRSLDKAAVLFKLSLHHSLSDRYSLNMIFEDVRAVYTSGNAPPPRPPFKRAIRFYSSVGRDAADRYWTNLLEGAEPNLFPVVPAGHITRTSHSAARKHKMFVEGIRVSKSTIINASWAYVLSKYSGSYDVVFGLIAWGRHAAVPGILNMAAPTANAIPFRATIDPSNCIVDFLADFQGRISELTAHQHIGIEYIKTLSSELKRLCSYNNVLIPQPSPSELKASSDLLGSNSRIAHSMDSAQPLVLQYYLEKDEIHIEALFDATIIPQSSVERLLSHFTLVIDYLSHADDKSRLCDVEMSDEEDTRLIAGWVSKADDLNATCVHQLVREVASTKGDAMAVLQTSSSLSYSELEVLSTALACELVFALGVHRGKMIPIIAKKTIWAVVGMLGIMKAGAAYVPIDEKSPQNRVQLIVDDVEADLILCSTFNDAISQLGGVRVFTLDKEHILPLIRKHSSHTIELAAQPDDIVYLIYTSGSTGIPKGAAVSHGAACTGLRAITKNMCVGGGQRYLQFSSLSFDISVMEIWGVLFLGGCICMPSDEERLYSLVEFMREQAVDYAVLTPTVAEILQPGQVPSLKLLSLGAEPLTEGLLNRWRPHVRLWGAYGPTETTVLVAYSDHNLPNKQANNLGYAVGGSLWIVDVDDPDKLSSVGAIGEIAVSGHTLARGYHRDPERTGQAFRASLQWTRGFPNHCLDRVYLTGDLGRYAEDGSILFLGRKDKYVKVAGYRIELGEIDYHLSKPLDHRGVCLVFESSDSTRKDLVVFFTPAGQREHDSSHYDYQAQIIPRTAASQRQSRDARDHLAENLPNHMIPRVFVPVTRMPYTSSGKLDKRFLLSLLTDMTFAKILEKYSITDDSRTAPSFPSRDLTDAETKLRAMWGKVLAIDPTIPNPGSHFISLGGDSRAAMALAGAARQANLHLPVSEIFAHPRLSAMARKMKPVKMGQKPIYAFELSPGGVRQSFAEAMKLSPDDICDIYPTSPRQAAFMTSSLLQPGVYMHLKVFRVASNFETQRLRAAFIAFMKRHSLLRTRLAYADDGQSYQAVVNRCEDQVIEVNSNSLEHILELASTMDFEIGKPLSNFLISSKVGSSQENPTFFAWKIHHSLYDGYSMGLLISDFDHVLSSESMTRSPPRAGDFRQFVRMIRDQPVDASQEFWKKYLDRLKPGHLCGRRLGLEPHRQKQPKTSEVLYRNIPVEWKKETVIRQASLIRAAFALALSIQTRSRDTFFSSTVDGRDMPIDHIKNICGPTFNVLPVRIQIDPASSIPSFLEAVEGEANELLKYQNLNLTDIAELSCSCRQVSALEARLIVHPPPLNHATKDQHPLRKHGIEELAGVAPNMSYPSVLIVHCRLSSDGGEDGAQRALHVKALFDEELLPAQDVEELLQRFEQAVGALNAAEQGAKLTCVISAIGGGGGEVGYDEERYS